MGIIQPTKVDKGKKAKAHSLHYHSTEETAVRVTVCYSDTFADPRGCHCNRRLLYQIPISQHTQTTT